MPHSDFQYDWVAVQDIERIEVVSGPMPVLYDGETLGGVVNVITRFEHPAGREERRAGVRERPAPRRFHQSMHGLERSHTSLG